MNYKDLSEQNINDHIDRIIDVVDEVVENGLGKVTTLTGGNASGKSVIRKLLPRRIADKLGFDDKRANKLVSSTSMQLRTGGSSNAAIIESWIARLTADLPWLSTSEQTMSLIKGLFKSCVSDNGGDENKRFIVIDELEIGMSKESQPGACLWLNQLLSENLDKTLGVLIIIHSDFVVKNIKFNNFINIDGMDCQEWLDHEIIPVMPDELSAWASALYKGIQKKEKKS